MPRPPTERADRAARARSAGREEGGGVPTPVRERRSDDQSADAKSIVEWRELDVADGLAFFRVQHPGGRPRPSAQIVEIDGQERPRHPWAGEGEESLGVGNPARDNGEIVVRPSA